MSWLFSCFKHDPSKDNLKTALKISRHQDEDTAARLKLEEELVEKAKGESLKEAEEEEAKRRLEKSKEKDKRKQVVDDDQVVEDKGQIKHSKDHVEENVNPSPSICKGCNSKVEDGRFVNAFDAVWHHQCLCCLHCHKQFALDEIPSLRGQYHKPCYKERRNCYVCLNKIPSTEDGIKYKEHPFWKEKYCPSHDDDGTAKCYSCERLESCATKYVMLEDGRWICRECLECAVMDSDECCDLHFEIREYFEGLYMMVEKEFPLLLVEKEALNKAEKEEKIDHQYEVVTRGICLSEEQMVTSVKKRPEEVNNQLKGMATESQMVVRQCEVTAILILYGLPKFLTGYILAHEMMHAYLRLKGYRNLNMVLEEGLCQVLGHMWLESQTYSTPDVVTDVAPVADSSSSSSSSCIPPLVATTSKKGYRFDFEKKFVDFCKYQIETDESPIYGVGFKKVNNMMVSNDHNLKDTLKQILSSSKSIPAPKF